MITICTHTYLKSNKIALLVLGLKIHSYVWSSKHCPAYECIETQTDFITVSAHNNTVVISVTRHQECLYTLTYRYPYKVITCRRRWRRLRKCTALHVSAHDRRRCTAGNSRWSAAIVVARVLALGQKIYSYPNHGERRGGGGGCCCFDDRDRLGR